MKAIRPLQISVLSLLVCATAPMTLSAATVQYWATDVSETSGWLTVGQGNTNMCWAATSSNLLAHYLSSAKGKGFTIPEGALTTNEQIFGWFCNEFNTAYGNFVQYGLEYYLKKNSTVFAGFMPTVENALKYNTDGGLGQAEILVEALSQGSPVGISMEDATDPNGTNHAVTVWGIEYNTETKRVSNLWITDSSGSNGNLTKYKEYIYNGKYYISEDSGRTDFANMNWKIYYLDYLKFPTIPEPSALGFLAGTLALAFATTRRRRSRKP